MELPLFSTLVYAVMTLATVASQSVTASTSELVVDRNRNSGSVKFDEEPVPVAGHRYQLIIKLKTEEIEPKDSQPQTAQHQSEGLTGPGIDTPNPWHEQRTGNGRNRGRRVLRSCSQRNQGRMLADSGKRGPPGSSRPAPRNGKPDPPAAEGPGSS